MKEKIVLQETDQHVLEALSLALETGGFEVFGILHCDETILDLIAQNKPHVVLLDYKLSGEASIDTLRRIRERCPHLPVIALSCNNNINEEFDRHGFDDYIRKPCDLDHLYYILRSHIPKLKDMVI